MASRRSIDNVAEELKSLSLRSTTGGGGGEILEEEAVRFANVRRKDFKRLERVRGRLINILEGLELHTGVFSVAEQRRIVDCIYDIQEKGRKGRLREHMYSEPRKWMRVKGRITIQFGCCYNYAQDSDGNPPGIIRDESVLVLNGNGANVAKHCVPVVLARRISVTFRKMEDSKNPYKFAPDPDLLNLSPLSLRRQQQPSNIRLRQDQPPQNTQSSQKVQQVQKDQQSPAHQRPVRLIEADFPPPSSNSRVQTRHR